MPSHLLPNRPRRAVCLFQKLSLWLFGTYVIHTGVTYGQIPPIIDLSIPDQPDVMRVYGASPNDQLGGMGPDGIAFGDINGDGYDDILIGSPKATVLNRDQAGTVYVIYGSSDLVGSQVDLAHLPSGHPVTKIIGKSNSHLGNAVACGDVNRDGYDDLILGAPNENIGPVSYGCVHVIFGAPHLMGESLDLQTLTDQVGHTRVLGGMESSETGTSLAMVDMNGDGYDDLLIGAPGASPTGRIRAGQVYLLQGSDSLPAVIDLATPPPDFPVTSILGDDPGDRLGVSVAFGDINGDGYEDALLGAPLADDDGASESGEVIILYGNHSPPSLVDLSLSPGANGETRIGGGQIIDYLGTSVASGDLNHDGFKEVLIGIPNGDYAGLTDCGNVAIIFGTAGMPGTPVGTGSFLNLNGPGTTPGSLFAFLYGTTARDQLGISVASSDHNSNGHPEIGAGFPYYDFASLSERGAIALVDGSSIHAGDHIHTSTMTADATIVGVNRADFLGYSCEGGADLNLDGFADFAASARAGDNPWLGDHNDSGYAVVVFGDGVASPTASVVEPFHAGSVLAKGLGGRLSPVVRCWLGFVSDSPSMVTATITRSKTLINNFPLGANECLADVFWQIQLHPREHGLANVTVQYVDREVQGMDKASLHLCQAPDIGGPWSLVTSQVHSATSHILHATVSSLACFAIVGVASPPLTATPSPTPSETSSNTITATITPTFSPTQTASSTFTATETTTPTASVTHTSTFTPVPTPSETITHTVTLTASSTPSASPSPTGTVTSTSSPPDTLTGTSTPTNSSTQTPSPSVTPTETRTASFTVTPTHTTSPTPIPTLTESSTFSPSPSPTWTTTPSGTATFTPTPSSSMTATTTPLPTLTKTQTGSPTRSWTQTPTQTHTPTPTLTATPASTHTGTPSFTESQTDTSTATASETSSYTTTVTPTNSPSFTSSRTSTRTHTPQPTRTRTPKPTVTHSETPTTTPTMTATGSTTPTETHSYTPSPTSSISPTISFTPSCTPSLIPSFIPSLTKTSTWTPSPSSTRTFTPSLSQTLTFTRTFSLTASLTPSGTSKPTGTSTNTSTFTLTPSITRTPSHTATMTFSMTPSATSSRTSSSTPLPIRTPSSTSTGTETPTLSFTVTTTRTSSLTETPVPTTTDTGTPTPTPSATLSGTGTPTHTPCPSMTLPPTSTRTTTKTPTASRTRTSTPTRTRRPIWTPEDPPDPSPTPEETPLYVDEWENY